MIVLFLRCHYEHLLIINKSNSSLRIISYLTYYLLWLFYEAWGTSLWHFDPGQMTNDSIPPSPVFPSAITSQESTAPARGCRLSRLFKLCISSEPESVLFQSLFDLFQPIFKSIEMNESVKTFVYFDIETTGLGKSDKITELSMVAVAARDLSGR